MTEAIHILLVEDNPGDARLVQVLLEEVAGRTAFAFAVEGALEPALERLSSETFDVVLLDLSLPDSQGLDTVSRLRAAVPGVPIVVLTGVDDEGMAIRAVQEGAQDYLVKGQGDGDLIRRAVRYAIERFRAESELRTSEARFRGIFENAGLGVLLVAPSGCLVEVNPAFHAMLGCEDGALRGKTVTEIVHPAEAEESARQMRALFAGESETLRFDRRFVRRDGEVVWTRINAALAPTGATGEDLVVEVVEDVTDRKRMEDELRMAAQVFENTSEGIFIADAEERIVHVNPAFVRLTGYGAEEAIGKTPEDLGSGRQEHGFYDTIRETLAKEDRWQGEVWNRRKTGETFVIWMDYSVVRDSRGEVVNHVAVFNDITARKENEERLAHQVNHDPLTDLPNRTLFHERLERALARAQRGKNLVALMFLDLDGFKNVNDVHGHLVGDMLLQAVAERLRSCTRQGDTVARIAGDEFTIILEDIDSVGDVAVVAEKILAQFQIPYDIDGHVLPVTTSIGISLFPIDGRDGETLLRLADAAMYKAKKSGRNSYQFHSQALNAKAIERLSLESALEQALDKKQFRLHFQGVHEVASGRLVGAEALLRWEPQPGKWLKPEDFLPLLEESRQIITVGRWVLQAACRQAKAWLDEGHSDLRLTVNISPLQLTRSDLIATVSQALADSKLPASLLELEFPEDALADQPGRHEGPDDRATLLTGLKSLGVRIAVGGFGTGHASFSRMRRLPVDVLKIDPAFVRDLGVDPADEGIVAAMTAMAHSLDMLVQAVGVENDAQMQWLRSNQCDFAQGHLLNRPCPSAEFARTVLRRHAGATSVGAT